MEGRRNPTVMAPGHLHQQEHYCHQGEIHDKSTL
jgi:hypothetical protein